MASALHRQFATGDVLFAALVFILAVFPSSTRDTAPIRSQNSVMLANGS